MNATNRWLDAAKRVQGYTSDYQLCKALGVSSARIGNYRGATSRAMDDDLALKVAILARVPPMLVLAEVAAERSKNSQLRSVWLDLARQAGKAALLVVAISAAMLVGNVPGGSASSPHHVEVSSALPALDARPSLNIMLSTSGADFNAVAWGAVCAVSHTSIALFLVFLLLSASARRPCAEAVFSGVH